MMLSAHFVGVAAWQTSGKGRSEVDRNCQAQMDLDKYVCVLAHAQNIANIFFQHAEPVVTVCQSLNFIRYPLPSKLTLLILPFKLSCLHPSAFVYLSLPPPVSLKLPLLSFFTHNFTFFISLTAIVRLE